MPPDVLILGEGLAGTLLAWELEQAGVSFAIADRGHAAPAATMAAAGIINPITGRRLVKSWRVDALLPAARTTYQEIEHACGVRLWHEMRVRRFFADERERAIWAEKEATGALAPFAGRGDEHGFWINAAARVDLRMLLRATRARWTASGRFLAGTSIDVKSHALVIDCTGGAVAGARAFGFVPWEFSKGEILELAVENLAADVVLNRRHWIAPIAPDIAWLGATHESGVRDAAPSAAGRTLLETSARALLGERAFTVIGQRAGVRVNLPDKHPVAGRHPADAQLGLINGLGAKGALWAPFLARQWVRHLTHGEPFDPEIEVRRFAK